MAAIWKFLCSSH